VQALHVRVEAHQVARAEPVVGRLQEVGECAAACAQQMGDEILAAVRDEPLVAHGPGLIPDRRRAQSPARARSLPTRRPHRLADRRKLWLLLDGHRELDGRPGIEEVDTLRPERVGHRKLELLHSTAEVGGEVLQPDNSKWVVRQSRMISMNRSGPVNPWMVMFRAPVA